MRHQVLVTAPKKEDGRRPRYWMVVARLCGWSWPGFVDTLRLGEEDTMPRSRPPYSSEYRQRMVDLVRGGRTPGRPIRYRGVRANGAVDLELGPPDRAG